MGMTIDESIGWIKKGILDMRRAELCISDRLALETAIAVMRKYQKIEQVVNDYKRYYRSGIRMTEEYWLERIKEVLEDGNDDCN